MKALFEKVELMVNDVVTASNGGTTPCGGEVIEVPTECGGNPEDE